MNWGTKIVITFISFAGIIITMVVISMQQDISLVAPDYYKQELAYQDQIDRLQLAQQDDGKLELNYEAGTNQLIITGVKAAQGTIHFYRPADASKDQKFNFDIKSGQANVISTKAMDRGLWRLKLVWGVGEDEKYLEKTIVI